MFIYLFFFRVDRNQRIFETQIIIEPGIKLLNYTSFKLEFDIFGESLLK